ncbi:MAG: hypothetical protein ACE5IW_06120 [bacterium]
MTYGFPMKAFGNDSLNSYQTFSNPKPVNHKMTSLPYRIEYQPPLVEEAVLRAIVGRKEESEFRKQRDRVYESPGSQEREEAFQELHQRWFERLGLNAPLQEVFSYWPVLRKSTHKCLLIKAASRKDIGADLYVAPTISEQTDREQRTIIIQLTPEILTQPKQLLEFLRHEFLHIVDMLDERFGYEPNFPKSSRGPTYNHFLQERYRILWDITIDGRLYKKGWLPRLVRQKHWTVFKDTFRSSEEALETMFAYFFDKGSHTHQELAAFAQSPESWFESSSSAYSSKGHCCLCHFPSFQLINASTSLSPVLMDEIRKEFPEWRPSEPICRQCADLFEARLVIPQS